MFEIVQRKFCNLKIQIYPEALSIVWGRGDLVELQYNKMIEPLVQNILSSPQFSAKTGKRKLCSIVFVTIKYPHHLLFISLPFFIKIAGHLALRTPHSSCEKFVQFDGKEEGLKETFNPTSLYIPKVIIIQMNFGKLAERLFTLLPLPNLIQTIQLSIFNPLSFLRFSPPPTAPPPPGPTVRKYTGVLR